MNDLSGLNAEQYQKKIGWLYRYLTERKPKVIRDLLSPDDRYGIDVGAGCGQYAEKLTRWGYGMIALEPNESLLTNYCGQYYVCYGENMPYKDKEFDFAYAINVLHHTTDPVGVLKEMWRVSRKVIIGELNKDCWLAMQYVRWFMGFDEQHLHYSTGDLVTLIRTARLPIKEVKHTPLLVIPNTFIWVVCHE